MDWEVVDLHAGYLAPDVPGWQVYLRDPNGVIRLHSLPQAALDWRLAEYGLATVAEALDVVLHETYADPEPEDTVPTMTSVVQTNQVKTQTVDAKVTRRPTLFEAKSTEEAKTAHLARVAEVKANKLQVVDPNGMLTHITDGYAPSEASLLTKREIVDTHRWLKLYGGLPQDPIPDPSEVVPVPADDAK